MAHKRTLTLTERITELNKLIASGEARKLRLAAGMSLENVGSDVGVTAAAVFRWESGERRPRGRNVIAYHQCLVTIRDSLREPQVAA